MQLNFDHLQQFESCVTDLFYSESVQSMKDIVHHVNVSCLDHCIFVSYVSFIICKKLGWDHEAAARGGLLHDLFLYDWKKKDSHRRLHGFAHPHAALKNAKKLCRLSDVESDIILAHMWPLTIKARPRYRESFVVCLADKLCALAEMSMIYRLLKMKPQFFARNLGQAV